MRLTEIEKLTKKELRQRVDDAFALADEKGPAYLMQGQFYMRELEHRHDSWISRRDLLLELFVILLIGGEIYMSIRAEHIQRSNFTDEKIVFENLQKNSAATASMLTALQTTNELNAALPVQVGEHSLVSIAITYTPADKHLMITNSGKYPIDLLGYQFDGRRGPKFKPPEPLKPGQSFSDIPTEGATKNMPVEPEDADKPLFLPFSAHFRLKDGTEYSSETMLAFTRVHGEFHVSYGATIVREYTWTRPNK